MELGQQKPFSQYVTIFHGRWLPEAAMPVGYAALIDAYDLNVPMPITLAAIGQRHRVYQTDGWNLYTPRHKPDADLEGHLVFALRYEGLDLAVLKTLFRTIGPEPITAIVKTSPTGAYRPSSGSRIRMSRSRLFRSSVFRSLADGCSSTGQEYLAKM